MDHAVVQRWLRQVLAPYHDPQRTYVDADAALVALSSLSPRTEVFTYNDGRSQLLLQLSGTIPIQYRSNTYNIPVTFWIPKTYPREPPMAFVVPTLDMLVRKGPNVDPSGEIGGDYLARWRSKPEGCSLLDLIRSCQQMFAQEPPVYARPKQPAGDAASSPSSTPSAATYVRNAAEQTRTPPPIASPALSTSHVGQGSATHPDARTRPPPPAPGQLAAVASSAQSPSGGAATPPSRPPKLAQSPEAIFSPPDFRRTSQDPAYFSQVNGHNLSTGYGPHAQPPTQLSFNAHRAASGDYSREAQQANGGGTHHAPHRTASLRISTSALQTDNYLDRDKNGPTSAGTVPEQISSRQSFDGRAAQPPPFHPPFQQQQYQHRPHSSPQQYRDPQQQNQRYDQQQQPQQQHYPAGGAAHVQAPALPGLPAANKTPIPSLGGYPYGSDQAPPRQPSWHQPQQASQPHQQQFHASYVSQQAVAQRVPPPPTQPLPPQTRQANLMDALDDDHHEGGGGGSGFATSGEPNGRAPPTTGPPPPRPPNPELLAMHDRLFAKIQSRFASLASSLDQSNQHLQVLASDLDRGKPAIEDEMRRLEAVRDVCKVTGDRTQETVDQAKARIEWLRQKEEPDVDGMVLATSIVANQLVDLVAEDNAIEDALYQLGRALNAERIDLDRFLKQTRMLAREQFMKRALAKRIVEGMGWQ